MKIVTVLVFALALVAWKSVAKSQGQNASEVRADNSTKPEDGLACNLTAGDIAALGPLLMKLGLAKTVEGVQQLLLKLNDAAGGLLLGPGVEGEEGLTALLNKVVVGLVGKPLDLDHLVTSLQVVVDKTVKCLATRK